jgi:hypothetical protein
MVKFVVEIDFLDEVYLLEDDLLKSLLPEVIYYVFWLVSSSLLDLLPDPIDPSDPCLLCFSIDNSPGHARLLGPVGPTHYPLRIERI